MDFSLLSKYDDLFTDIFLDTMHLWFNTIKMNSDHRRPRIPTAKVLDIIQRSVVDLERPSDAAQQLLSMDYFKHFLATKDDRQSLEFIQHLKRYLYMFMPNAGFEIGETRRYTGSGRRVEACLLATKDWHVGDEIRQLNGVIACLDPAQDAELKRRNRDFSVMWSTRKGCSCLFLGPARFVNHDCDSNCKFISYGKNSITLKVIKEIQCGEELTAFYGKHYFGENNNECRCETCESRGTGYFESQGTTPSDTPSDTLNESTGMRRSGRKRKSTLREDYASTPIHRKRRSLGDPALQPPTDLMLQSTRNERPSVMCIDFLCSEVKVDPDKDRDAMPLRHHSTSPLDLLCDAVMDAAYLKKSENDDMARSLFVQPLAHVVADFPVDGHTQLKETAYWGSEDDGHRVLATQEVPSRSSLTDSIDHGTRQVVDEEAELDERAWVDDMGDFLDDLSDVSSVVSALSNSDTEEADDDEGATSATPLKKKPCRSQKEDLLECIACGQELKALPKACADASLNELATWTWSPSAVFTGWRPKRCPRCERHFTIFKHEWPVRKLKKPNIKKRPKKETGKSLRRIVNHMFSMRDMSTSEETEEDGESDTTDDAQGFIPPPSVPLTPISDVLADF